MNKRVIGSAVGIAVVVLAIALWASAEPCDAKSGTCEAKGTQTQAAEDKLSKIDEINQALKYGALLIDVREPSEYATGHAVGSTNIPLGDIENGAYPTKDKDAKIYLYCRSGKRAQAAQAVLKNAGFKEVTNIGGLSDWQDMGGKVAKD